MLQIMKSILIFCSFITNTFIVLILSNVAQAEVKTNASVENRQSLCTIEIPPKLFNFSKYGELLPKIQIELLNRGFVLGPSPKLILKVAESGKVGSGNGGTASGATEVELDDNSMEYFHLTLAVKDKETDKTYFTMSGEAKSEEEDSQGGALVPRAVMKALSQLPECRF